MFFVESYRIRSLLSGLQYESKAVIHKSLSLKMLFSATNSQGRSCNCKGKSWKYHGISSGRYFTNTVEKL